MRKKYQIKESLQKRFLNRPLHIKQLIRACTWVIADVILMIAVVALVGLFRVFKLL